MTEYKNIKIPTPLVDIIDSLVESGEYSSRAEYTKELLRADFKKRGLMGVSEQ